MSETETQKPNLEDDQGIDVDLLLERLPMAHGMIFAELFAKRGFSTVPVARLLQGTGTVFALEEKGADMGLMRATLDEEGLTGWVIPVECDGPTFPMPDTSVDLATWANSFGATDASSGYLKEAYRILRPQGVLVLIDAIEGLEHAKSESESAGFELQEEWSLYPGYYTLVFQRPAV